MAMLILLVLLIFFAALGIPLAFAIGASCVTYILIYAPTFITMRRSACGTVPTVS